MPASFIWNVIVIFHLRFMTGRISVIMHLKVPYSMLTSSKISKILHLIDMISLLYVSRSYRDSLKLLFSNPKTSGWTTEHPGQTPHSVPKTYLHHRVPQESHVPFHFVLHSALLRSVTELKRCTWPAGDSCDSLMNETIHTLCENEFPWSYPYSVWISSSPLKLTEYWFIP